MEFSRHVCVQGDFIVQARPAIAAHVRGEQNSIGQWRRYRSTSAPKIGQLHELLSLINHTMVLPWFYVLCHLTAGTERKYNCFIPSCVCGNVRPLKEEDPMKRILSTILAVGLLLGLAALAVLARGGGDILTPVKAAPVALAAAQPQTAAAPDAPATGPNWNAIAMALDSTATLANAQALANAIPGTQQLLMWDTTTQAFDFYVPYPVYPDPLGLGNNFNLTVGMPVMVQVDSTASTVFSLVGNVPPQTGQTGAVQFSLVGGTPCKWNFVSLPLDQGSITNAQQLADAIDVKIGGGIDHVQQLLVWDATSTVQAFDFYVPYPIYPDPLGLGNNFTTKIGYPYMVCVDASTTWP